MLDMNRTPLDQPAASGLNRRGQHLAGTPPGQEVKKISALVVRHALDTAGPG
jgi:hypothetical protein